MRMIGFPFAPWRGVLLSLLLLLLFALLLVLTVLKEQPPLDELPLRGVPEDEYVRAGITLEPAYHESAAYHSEGAELLAKEMTCCGIIRQVVLVRLQKADAIGPGILSYAVNWDTSTAPETPPLGGHWRTGFTRDIGHFVLFLDADTGEHIYSLFPGSQYPWPASESGVGFKIPLVTVRNVDGPNVFVTVWTLSPETTVVECGEEKVVTSAGGGYFSLTVRDATIGKSLFESEQIDASRVWTMLVRKDGVILGHDLVSSVPLPAGDVCG